MRKNKENMVFFRHDVRAWADYKIQSAIYDMGPMAYGIFWGVVELLYENNGLCNIESLKIISRRLNVSVEDIERLLNGYDLFKFDGDNFYSDTVNINLSLKKQLSEKNSQSGKISAERRWGEKPKDDWWENIK